MNLIQNRISELEALLRSSAIHDTPVTVADDTQNTDEISIDMIDGGQTSRSEDGGNAQTLVRHRPVIPLKTGRF